MNPFDPNDGSRPSRLMLARLHTGELDADDAAAVEQAIASDPTLQLAMQDLDDARASTPPLDLVAIRSRVSTPPEPRAPVVPEPANRPRWHLFLPLIVAALVLFALVPTLAPTDPATAPYVGVRGDPTLFVHHLIGGALRDYDGRPLGQGESIGLSVHGGAATGVVVVSIDGNGTAKLMYPDAGIEPEPLEGDGRTVALPGTLILDDSPGPEVFLAIFDKNVREAFALAADQYDRGGVDALLRWAADDPMVDAVSVERR